MVTAQSIDIAAGEGRAIFAHLAAPDAGSGPGLVLFHDLSDDDGELRELCEFYAEEGYLVLCRRSRSLAAPGTS
jgi:carboxymethylenebutenolidase